MLSTMNRLSEKSALLARKLPLGFFAVVFLFLVLPTAAHAQFTCPPTDQLGFSLGQSDTTTDPIFCSYPAVPGEDPHDFFCTYSKTTGALVQDNDAGLCTANAVPSGPPPTSASLSVTKTHVGTFTQGGTGEWDITVSNGAGASTTTGTTTVSDTLPSGYTVNAFTGTDASWTCMGAGTQTATCTSTAAKSGGSSFLPVKITVNIPANSPASVMNTGNAYGGGDTTHTSLATAASGSDTVSVSGSSANPPTLAKAFGTANLAVNSSTSLSFSLTNPAGNAVTFTGLAFTDTLPAGLVVSTPNGLTGSCPSGTITATAGTNGISLTGATLAAGVACTFSVNVTGTSVGVKTNTTGTVTDTQGITGSAATATLTVVLPPTISKAFADSQIELNFIGTTLSLTITNPAANPISFTDIAVTDTLPAGVVLATPSSGLTTTCPGGGSITAPAGGSTITASGVLLQPGTSCTISVQVLGAALGTFTNTTSPVVAVGGTVVGNTASATISLVDQFFLWFFSEGGGGSNGKP
jgi:hypothetical protein